MTKIYTTAGDDGFTRRLDGTKLRKDDPQLSALGDLDALSSNLGLCLCLGKEDDNRDEGLCEKILDIQRELMLIGSLISSAKADNPIAQTLAAATGRLESDIDAFTAQCPPLGSLIIPGGCRLACELHQARCLCRNAERSMVGVADPDKTTSADAAIMKYLNRLGDWLFAAARLANHSNGIEEPLASGE